MALRLSTGFRNMLLGDQPFRDIFLNGVIYIYTGSQPSNADSAAPGTLLGKVTVEAGAFNFGSATNGLQFAAPSEGRIEKDGTQTWQFAGEADGTAGWGRLMGNALDEQGQSETLPRLDFSIGQSTGDLRLSNTSIVQGATYTIDEFAYRIRPQN